MQTLTKPITIRTRLISTSELDYIRHTIAMHWDTGRSAISRILCEHWNWRQANGQFKGMACRDLLLRLERMGYIDLPPRQKEKNNCCTIADLPQRYHLANVTPLSGRIDSYRQLQIELATAKAQRELWDSLMASYHYLGCTPIVGSSLKYLLYLDAHLVCCIGWGSAAWKVACRDQHIGWTRTQRQKNLNGIANNVRFLILPWINITHLASKALALASQKLIFDWPQRFGEAVLLAETFVEVSRYAGTSYRAANWDYLGTTAGCGKRGASYYHHGRLKSVFVYPLHRNFRAGLCR